MVPGVILEIRLNIGRTFLCVYITPCTPAAIMSAIFIPNQIVLSWLGGVTFENGLVSRAYVRFTEVCE